MSNLQIVTEFCEAWRTRDVSKILSYLTSDCFYHNIPIAPVVGTDAISDFVGGFMKVLEDVEFVIHHIAEEGTSTNGLVDDAPEGIATNGFVLTERTDKLKINGRWIELPVMGIFELRDGKISHWRDYYDQQTMDQGLASATNAGEAAPV